MVTIRKSSLLRIKLQKPHCGAHLQYFATSTCVFPAMNSTAACKVLRLPTEELCIELIWSVSSLVQDNASSLASRVKKTDAREIEAFYQQYYKHYVSALDQGEQADRYYRKFLKFHLHSVSMCLNVKCFSLLIFWQSPAR